MNAAAQESRNAVAASTALNQNKVIGRLFSQHPSVEPLTDEARALSASLAAELGQGVTRKSLAGRLKGDFRGLVSRKAQFSLKTATNGTVSFSGKVTIAGGELFVAFVPTANGALIGIIESKVHPVRDTRADQSMKRAMEALGFKIAGIVDAYQVAYWDKMDPGGVAPTIARLPDLVTAALSPSDCSKLLLGDLGTSLVTGSAAATRSAAGAALANVSQAIPLVSVAATAASSPQRRCNLSSFFCSTNGTGAICSKDNDCGHNECSEGGECRRKAGKGPNLCEPHNPSMDCRHRECEIRDRECIERPGEGRDLCTSRKDCAVPSHKECRGQYCVPIDGAGADRCGSHGDCEYHFACKEDFSCGAVKGKGLNECSGPSELPHPYCYHMACAANGSCETRRGRGENTCNTIFNDVDSGLNSNCSHKACRGGVCEQIPGKGADECFTDDTCRHRECSRDGTCDLVAGQGQSTCSSHRDCGAHRECSGFHSCKIVKGDAPDSCREDIECDAHKECAPHSFLCDWVSGPGANTCENDSQCGHRVCSADETCVRVSGTGYDQCTQSTDCLKRTCVAELQQVPGQPEGTFEPTGKFICMKKPGLLKDTCNIDEDCLKIGEQLVSLSPANRAALETNSSSDMAEQPRARMKEEALLRYDVSILFDLPSQGASIGSPTAPVKITVYQDLKCGMCKYAFQRVLPEIAGNYLATGKAHITFKEYPLIPRELEMKLAEAAKCAGEQGKYAAFVAEMYSDKTESSLEKIVDYAERASLDGAMFQACRDSGRAMASVESDISDGKKLAIEGTPMFFVNDTVIKGAQPFDRFKVAIDQELARTN